MATITTNTGNENGQSRQTRELDGSEVLDIRGHRDLQPRMTAKVTAGKPDGRRLEFEMTARLDYRRRGCLFKEQRNITVRAAEDSGS